MRPDRAVRAGPGEPRGRAGSAPAGRVRYAVAGPCFRARTVRDRWTPERPGRASVEDRRGYVLAARAEQGTGGGRADLLHLLVHGGEPGVQPTADRQVVVPHHRHVPGTSSPLRWAVPTPHTAMESLEYTRRSAGRPASEQFFGDGDGRPLREVRVPARRRAAAPRRAGRPRSRPAQPGVHQFGRSRDVRETPVAQPSRCADPSPTPAPWCPRPTPGTGRRRVRRAQQYGGQPETPFSSAGGGRPPARR